MKNEKQFYLLIQFTMNFSEILTNIVKMKNFVTNILNRFIELEEELIV